MTTLTPEYMKRWEQSLTKQQMDYAMHLAIQNGWARENPPMWVWAEFFRMATLEYPPSNLNNRGDI